MTDSPFFSIVVSTFGRGRHIAPTIESVLQQTFSDFELIVVGDGCNDETESVVRSFSDARISWRNLPRNMGSQSFPNNEGIRAARGGWIAYLGHDDIWTRDHLAAIHAANARTPDAGFIVSGCVYHTPPGTGLYYVHGLFENPDAARRNFFPPSSIAHRRDVSDRIGAWSDPRAIVSAVDQEFMARAVAAQLKFVSTGEITVHKFAAGHRYLSYLRVESDEQSAMLNALKNGAGPDHAHILSTAKRNGTFMPATEKHLNRRYRPGFLFERNRQNKGISRQQLSPLHERTVIGQNKEGRALDWRQLEWRLLKKVRCSGPNPRPKILIPFTGQQARIMLEIYDSNLDGLSLYAEDREIQFRVEKKWFGLSLIVADIPLKPDDYTVLTFERPAAPLGPSRQDSLAIGNIAIEPVTSPSTRT